MGSKKYKRNSERELTCIDCKKKFIGHYARKRCDACKKIKEKAVRAAKHKKEYYADLEKSRKKGREEYHRNKHKKTPEQIAHDKAYRKKWREDNREHEAQVSRAYWSRNKAKRAEITNRYRSLKINARIASTDDKKIALIFKKCREKTKKTGIRHQVDHIIPLSIGGADHQDNLRIITAQENGLKGDKYIPELGGIWADNELARETKKKLGLE